jgi:hypothetical protein
MTDVHIRYWRSKNGCHWELVDVIPTSVVGQYLAQHPAGTTYDDGSGYRYFCDIEEGA